MDKVVFILGPTGSGKSKLAVALAKTFNGEIISADSVQIYKGFDIGSAKVTKQEMAGIPHHCIDICQPCDYFSVSDFVDLTKAKIKEISARGNLPIVVGGTGLYINSLASGYNFGGTSRHDNFRAEIEKEIETKGLEAVWERLNRMNPSLAAKVDKLNKVRLVRALEIATFGEEVSADGQIEFEYKIFALDLERQKLYDRINKRVDKMLKDGLVDEVERLIKSGVKTDAQPMRAIGYKEVVGFLKGEYDEARMTEIIKQHSRNYAKRQLTYLRGLAKTHDVTVVDIEDFTIGQKQIESILKEWL